MAEKLPKTPKEPQKGKELPFEAAIKRLEEIVSVLEKGDATLDQSLALFEEGTTLVRGCSGALNKAEQKLKVLVKTEDGPKTADFDAEDN